MLLENTRFRRGYCPFYKSKEQSELDRKKSEKRLIKLGYIKPKKKRKQPTEKKDGEVINGEGIHGDQGKNPAEGQSE